MSDIQQTIADLRAALEKASPDSWEIGATHSTIVALCRNHLPAILDAAEVGEKVKEERDKAIAERNESNSYLCGCVKHGRWQGMACIGCLEAERDAALAEVAEWKIKCSAANNLVEGIEKENAELRRERDELHAQLVSYRQAEELGNMPCKDLQSQLSSCQRDRQRLVEALEKVRAQGKKLWEETADLRFASFESMGIMALDCQPATGYLTISREVLVKSLRVLEQTAKHIRYGDVGTQLKAQDAIIAIRAELAKEEGK